MFSKKIIPIILLFSITFTVQSQITDGLIAKYSFNEGNANDEIGTNHGTVFGATSSSDRFGNVDAAYSFDGIDDHINLGDLPEFQMGTNDFTISFWINYSVAQQSSILSKRDGGASNYNQYNISILADYQFGGVSQNMWSFLRTSTSNDRHISIGDLTGSWHHLTIVHKYNDSTSAFVDGQFIGSDPAAITGDLNIIGRELVLGYSSEMGVNFYNGMLDDLYIYNRALINEEVQSLYSETDPYANISKNSIEDIMIYPNPSSSEIIIKVNHPTDISITNSIGQEIEHNSIISSQTIDVSYLETGIYFLKDLNSGTIQKFVKQ